MKYLLAMLEEEKQNKWLIRELLNTVCKCSGIPQDNVC